MSGTKAGGLKTRDKNLASNPDYYRIIGAKGGSVKFPKGFAIDTRSWLEKLLRRPKRAVWAGKKGGERKKGWKNG